MDKLARGIVKNKILIFILFGVLTAACAVMTFFVKVNYDSASYLPDDSEVKKGITVMYDEFGDNGNASVMVKGLSFEEALNIKRAINEIDGVQSVMWLDDTLSKITEILSQKLQNYGISQDKCAEYLLITIEFLPKPEPQSEQFKTEYAAFLRALVTLPSQFPGLGDMSDLSAVTGQLETFYKDKNALFQVIFDETDYSEKTTAAIDGIKNLDVETYLIGNAATTYNSIKVISKQTTVCMIVVFVIVLAILFLTSSSFFEPVLYIAAIGVAVILNMGTNLFIGNISYMTKSVAAVLQLALTIDYSIFLLHRYKQEKERGLKPDEAMVNALKRSFSPISASSLTTISSFIAIMFMSYTLGFNLGIVLAKGVVFSLLTVFLLLPVLAVKTDRAIAKSEHRTFKMEFRHTSKFIVKSRFILPVLFLALIIPAFFLQSNNTFVYGNRASFGSEGSAIYDDRIEIENTFGNQNQMVILLDNRHADKEAAISAELAALESVESVQSLSLIEQSGAADMMPESFALQFYRNGNYRRIIMNTLVPEEGEEAKKCVQDVEAVLARYVDSDAYYLLGETPSALDTEKTVDYDYDVITIISLALVGVILIINFKSALLPILLLFVIQGSVYINMAVPYLLNTPIVFIGYLIVSAILLGATIDYAILFTSNYLEARKVSDKFEAVKHALKTSSKAIITSAGILTIAGFTIGLISTMPTIVVFGEAVGRGGLSALILVLFFLPQLLMIFDKPIKYTTYKANKTFFKGDKIEECDENRESDSEKGENPETNPQSVKAGSDSPEKSDGDNESQNKVD